MASKIHLFKKMAIAAGSPNNYYLNPSENLFKIASKWSVIEHEDVINLTIRMHDFGNSVYISSLGKFIDINVGEEEFYKKRPAGYADKDGLKNFSIEMNPNFLKLGIKGDDIKGWEGISRMYISKLTPEQIKNKEGPKINASYLDPEGYKNRGPYTATISVGRMRK